MIWVLLPGCRGWWNNNGLVVAQTTWFAVEPFMPWDIINVVPSAGAAGSASAFQGPS